MRKFSVNALNGQHPFLRKYMSLMQGCAVVSMP